MSIEGRNILDPNFGGSNIRTNQGTFASKSTAQAIAGTIRTAAGEGVSSNIAGSSKISRMAGTISSGIGNNTLELQKILQESGEDTQKEFERLTNLLSKNIDKTGKAQVRAMEEIRKQMETIKLSAGDRGESLAKAAKFDEASEISKGGFIQNVIKDPINSAFGADEGQGVFQGIAQSFKEPERLFGTKGLVGNMFKAGAADRKAKREAVLNQQGDAVGKAVSGGKILGSGLDVEASPITEKLDKQRKILEEIRDGVSDVSGGLGSNGGLVTGLIGGLGTLLTAKLLKPIANFAKSTASLVSKAVAKVTGREVAEAGIKVAAREGAEQVAETGIKVAAREGAEQVAESGSKVAATAVAGTAEATTRSATKQATETLTVETGEQAVKSAAKAGLKSKILGILGKKVSAFGLKQVPLVGAAAGGVFALGRLLKGDFAGAAAEAGGIFLPSVAGAPLDLGLMARDVYNEVYGTEGNPFPHDQDAISNPEYGENYAQIYDTIKGFFTDQNEAISQDPETADAEGNLVAAESEPRRVDRRGRPISGSSSDSSSAIDTASSVPASSVQTAAVPTAMAVDNVTTAASGSSGGGGAAPIIQNVTNNNNNSSNSSPTNVFASNVRNQGSSLSRYNDRVFMG